MFNFENFYKGLAKANPNSQIIDKEDFIEVNYINSSHVPKLIGLFEKKEIEDALSSLHASFTYTEYALYNKTYYETLVLPQDRKPLIMYKRFDSDHYQTKEHDYSFSLAKPSVRYCTALLCYISEHDNLYLDLYHLHRLAIRDEQISSLQTLFESFRILTAKLVAPTECSITEFKKLLQAYLFNIAYFYDTVYVVSPLADTQRPISRSIRRSGQLFPYKHYNPELVKYYYQGMSSDIAFTQYLAFYHVAEFFFQTIAEQDAFQEIEAFITRPSFSPYRKEDIRQFYNKIKKKNARSTRRWCMG